MILNPENYCIPRRHRLFRQTTKQPLSNFEPQKSWKYKHLWVLRHDPSCLQKSVVSYNFSFYVVQTFFYKQHFYKQYHCKQMLSNTLRLNFYYHSHPKIIGHILKNNEKNKWVCFYEITCLIRVKMMMKMKNRSHRYEIVIGLDIQ